MKMHELGPAYGATTKRKIVGRGIGSGTGKTAGKDTKDKKLELAEKLEEDLKVDKHLYIEEFQREDSTIILQKNIQLSMYLI